MTIQELINDLQELAVEFGPNTKVSVTTPITRLEAAIEFELDEIDVRLVEGPSKKRQPHVFLIGR